MSENNKQYFRIVGNAVELITERVERTVTLTDLLKEVDKESAWQTPMLPAGCRMCREHGGKTVFVIEQAPQVRNLFWKNIENNENGNKWRLAFPYVVFIITFSGEAISADETKIFYSRTPLVDESSLLLRVNVANVHDNGKVCTGSVRVEGKTLAQKAESFVSKFWQSEFNSDLIGGYKMAKEKFPQVASLAKWQEETKNNPLFPLAVEWIPVGKLEEML